MPFFQKEKTTFKSFSLNQEKIVSGEVKIRSTTKAETVEEMSGSGF